MSQAVYCTKCMTEAVLCFIQCHKLLSGPSSPLQHSSQLCNVDVVGLSTWHCVWLTQKLIISPQLTCSITHDTGH